MTKKTLLAVSSAMALLIAPAAAHAETAAPAAQSPYELSNHSWVTLTGEVVATREGQIALDYGGGSIGVELDDRDRFDEANLVSPGERLTVFGRIDADFGEVRTIEADSIFVHSTQTYYSDMSAADDEADPFTMAYVTQSYAYPVPATEGAVFSVGGIVRSIDADENEFVIDTGWNDLQVDADYLTYNPLMAEGDARLSVGDDVRVTGRFDEGVVEDDEILATSVVTLRNSTANAS